MKTIVAGSRGASEAQVRRALELCPFTKDITEVVCGGARGADLYGKEWALENNIPVKDFPADWTKYGKSAGIIRNIAMAGYADAFVAVWDGKSPGTKNMISIAGKRHMTVFVHKF